MPHPQDKAIAHVATLAAGGPGDPSWRVTLHFHPDIQPALGFDPATIQDDFDPFDVSDYVNFDN